MDTPVQLVGRQVRILATLQQRHALVNNVYGATMHTVQQCIQCNNVCSATMLTVQQCMQCIPRTSCDEPIY